MTFSAGILLVDKPPGATSHDVVDWLRFVTRTPTGHAGTLDPAATGLLVVLMGAATKFAGFFAAEDKTYVARFRLGIRTLSDDLDGDVVERVEVRDEDRRRALSVLAELRGDLELPPPAMSAVHVDGQRAHVRARRGELLALPPRPMSVRAVEGATLTPEGDLEATLHVSKGTYVRSLAVELGRRVGLPCTLAGLRRTRSGRLSLDGALPVLRDLRVEARARPDGIPAVRIRLAAPRTHVVAPDLVAPGAAEPAASDGASSPVRVPPPPGVLSRDESRARIAAHVVPLVQIAPFPCVHADDERSRDWLRRLALGQRLSAYEEGLCARLGRPLPPPREAQQTAAPQDLSTSDASDDASFDEPVGRDSPRDHAAIYGALADGAEPLLVLCAWSPGGERLEPKRTIRGGARSP